MTEKRFFYDCPIKAAFMVRYHGMKIHGPVRKPTGGIDTSARPMPVWILARAIEAAEKGMGPADAQYYLSDDSLHLIEPREGDTGSDGEYSGRVCGVDATLVTVHVPERHNGKNYFCCPRSIFKTETRNGIAFMYPQSEDA